MQSNIENIQTNLNETKFRTGKNESEIKLLVEEKL